MSKSAAAKQPKFETVLRWHEKNMTFERNDKGELIRPALSAAFYDANTQALVSANGYSLQLTWGDFSDHADEHGWITVKKSADDFTDAHFPDYLAIIPSHFEIELSVTAGQLEQAVKLAHVFSKDSNESTAFALCPTDGLIAVSGKSAERGDCISHVDAGNKHAGVAQIPVVVSLDAALVLDALSGFADADVITFKANHWNDPVLIGNDARLAVIMPMNAIYGTDAKAYAERLQKTLEQVDYNMPREYSPAITWKQSQKQHPENWQGTYNDGTPMLMKAAKVTADTRADAKAREARETASAALVRDIDAPFVRGSWIPASVQHDPRRGMITDVLAKETYGMFYKLGRDGMDSRVVLSVSKNSLKIITYRDEREAAAGDFSYWETYSFTLVNGSTEYSLSRKYRNPHVPCGTPKSGKFPFVMSAKTFVDVLRTYLPANATLIIQWVNQTRTDAQQLAAAA